MRRATVWWGDAHSSSSEFNEEGILEQHRAINLASTGWIVRRNAKGVTLVLEYTADESMANSRPYAKIQFIPRGMIQRIEWLEPK